MMDISLPTLAPRVVAERGPAADASATARTDRPPPAVAVGPVSAPASLTQEALVTQSALGPDAVGATEGTGAVQRVLKPWGVPMLPWDSPPKEAGSSGDLPAGARPSRHQPVPPPEAGNASGPDAIPQPDGQPAGRSG